MKDVRRVEEKRENFFELSIGYLKEVIDVRITSECWSYTEDEDICILWMKWI